MRFVIQKTIPHVVRYRYSLSIEGYDGTHSWAFTDFPGKLGFAEQGKQCIVTKSDGDDFYEGRAQDNRVVITWDFGTVLNTNFDLDLEFSTFVLWGNRVRGFYELVEKEHHHNLWYIHMRDPSKRNIRRIRS